ncbi:MAG TPA: TonB-dependent receptor [Bryobacteraceae bacterium]
MRKLVIPLMLLMFSQYGVGQTTTGTISGRVLDTSGAAIPKIAVKLRNTATGELRNSASDNSGDYLFPDVPTGTYEVEAEAPGFKRTVRGPLTLDVNQNARLDLALQVGSVSEVVEVKGGAPLVDTREVQLGATLDSTRIQELPLNGRNIYDLMQLTPGTANVSTTLTGSNDSNYMNVNGNRIRENNFFLDGAFNNSLFRNGGNMAPNPDAIDEFHLITSNFDAEYGRLPGSVMNVVTKSGSNRFHGTLFDFLRNDSVNARNFFQSTVNPLKRNQFGGTLGGAIRKNRTFFFVSYQGLRLRTANYENAVPVPTLAMRRGNFSALPSSKWPVDPLTGKQFPGGMIPSTRLDPVAEQILNQLVPLPNNSAGTYSDSESAPTNDDQGMLRIDHQLSDTNKLSGTLFIDRSTGITPFGGISNIANYGILDSVFKQDNVILSDTWTASPTIVNEAHVNYSRNFYATTTPVHTSWSDFGSQIPLGATPPRPPQITVTGYWQGGTYGDDTQPQTTYGGTDVLTWIRGSHSIKAGGSFLWNHFEETGNWLGAGQSTFSGAYTKNAEADFELGEAATFRQNSGLNRNFTGTSSGLFVQDDWKAARRLTLNLGLRWELNTPYTSAGNALATFDAGAESKRFPTAPLGMLFPGDPGIPDGIAPTKLNNFAPRVGVAWDVFGTGKTAVRAGYGIFYAASMINLTSNLQNQPFILDLTLFGTANLVNPWASQGGSPFPYTLTPSDPRFVLPATANYLGEDSKTPYVQQYNFTLQQQIGSTMSLQVGYVGNVSHNLYVQRDANTPTYLPGASSASNVNNRRPYLPGVYGAIYELESGGSASYSSLQATFTRKLSHGFSLLANYTWSRSIDILSDDPTSISSVGFVDSNNFALDRAVSSFNVPQVLSMSWVWQAPAFRYWGVLGREIIGGWELDGLMTAREGLPLNVTSGTDTNLDGNTNDRPNLVANPILDSGRPTSQVISEFFNTAAFAALPAGQLYGSAGRNILVGPSAVDWDVSAFKAFSITEHQSLQFRTDLFNVFNEVNFSNPNTTLTSANFGKITAAGSPRILQFALKFIF